MGQLLFQVIEAAAGNRYFTGINTEIPPTDKVVAPKPGEPGLSKEVAQAMCANLENFLFATTQQVELNPNESAQALRNFIKHNPDTVFGDHE